jgi:long-chain fatty acid transport protein
MMLMAPGIFVRAFVTLSFLLLLPDADSAHAAGPVHGAKAAGMGTAFIAVADDPSAISHNPAGITQITGRNVYAGNAAIMPYTSYESPAGVKEETESQVFFSPHLYYTHELAGQDLTLGLGFFSPFGIGGRKWDETGQLRYFSTETFIATFTVNPTVAWRISDRISLALGLDYMKAKTKARNKIDQSFLGAPDGSMELEADGDGWGYNLGLLVKLTDSIKLGLAFRSAVTVDMEGDLTLANLAPPVESAFGGAFYQTPVATSSEFPAIFSFGLTYSPGEKWTLAADFELVRWRSFTTAELDVHQEVPPFLVDTAVPLDWQDSRQFKLGLDYRCSQKLSLRSGYAYITAPVPDHTLAPGNPDADVHNLSVGFGYRTGRWTLDGFYDLGLYESRRVDNAILAGKYENRVHFLGFSAGYRL